jgi:adenine-specific DNA methylase
MSQKYPKRLIEVDLPIRRISAHARREKSIRHGHISTLHIWWARRPLAACRAVICASLWPDPADPLCPQTFRDRATKIIFDFASAAVRSKELGESCDHETWIKWQAMAQKGKLDSHNEAHWNILRFALLDFIADFANWDNSTVKEYLDTSRALTQAAHEALGGQPGTRPLVIDPFAGGGSIPLEALRVGADAFASDLNPVPVLLNKVVLEYIPRYGQRLADEVRKWSEWIYRELKSEVKEFYPSAEGGFTAGAFLWARTILSEAPSDDEFPIEVPLLRSLILLKKSGRYQALRWARASDGKIKSILEKVIYADGTTLTVRRPLLEVFQPKSLAEVEKGTSSGGAATCPITGYTTSVESVRRQLLSRKGGAADARLICVIASRGGGAGRTYLDPRREDLAAAYRAGGELAKRASAWKQDIPMIPDGPLNHLRGFFNVVLYGMTTWGDLFSPRQALGLTTLARLVQEVAPKEEDIEFKIALQTCLALALDRCADKCASLVVWDNTRDMATHVFGRQALPMIWDFAEVNILSDNGWDGAADWVLRVIETNIEANLPQGTASRASATANLLPDDTVDSVVTDPPYYAAIPYADLSDFFYSWLKRSVGHLYPDLFNAPLSPKDEECVSLSHRAAMYRNKDAKWFETTMAQACAECSRISKPGSVSVFVFANKETAGWEAMLGALIGSGWTITGSWPVDTEMGNRLRAQNSAALASSVHLVCRPRKDLADTSTQTGIGDWRDILHQLPVRIHEWMPRLADEGVVGADAIFACLGPALEIFSRYSRVEKGNGDTVTLREYLEQVWAAVAKEALVQVFKGADATGFEPDARMTAMWLWTLNAPAANGKNEESDDDADDEDQEPKKPKAGGFRLEYDAARKIAQGLGAVLENLTHLVEVKGDEARLLPVAERTRHLFGKGQEEAAQPARKKASTQMNMFAELTAAEDAEAAWQEKTVRRLGETTLDRVHQAMILFAAGRGDALKRFVVDDGVGRDGKFWRLAQALSALYPTGTDERRWVEGVMARKKQFGF